MPETIPEYTCVVRPCMLGRDGGAARSRKKPIWPASAATPHTSASPTRVRGPPTPRTCRHAISPFRCDQDGAQIYSKPGEPVYDELVTADRPEAPYLELGPGKSDTYMAVGDAVPTYLTIGQVQALAKEEAGACCPNASAFASCAAGYISVSEIQRLVDERKGLLVCGAASLMRTEGVYLSADEVDKLMVNESGAGACLHALQSLCVQAII